MARLEIQTALVGVQAVNTNLQQLSTNIENLGTTGAAAGRKLDAGFKPAAAGFDGLAQKALSLRNVMGALGVAVGVGTVQQFGRFLRSSLDAAGGLGELAQQTGVSTKLLQEMQYAAVQNGLSIGEATQSISFLSRTIGDAAAGVDEAADAFNRLGIDVTDANGNLRSTEDVMRDAAERISRMGSAAQQASAAADLFGRSGRALLPILTQGAAGFDALAKAAADAGVVLDDAAIAKADLAADRLAVLDLQVEKLGQNFAIVFAPAVSDAAGAMNEFLGELANAPSVFDAAVVAGKAWVDLLIELQTLPAQAGAAGAQALDQMLNPITQGFPTGGDRGTTGLSGQTTLPVPGTKPLEQAEIFYKRLQEMLAKVNEEAAKTAAQQQAAVDKVVQALGFEIESWGMTATQIRIATELQKAGITADDQRAAGIAQLVEQIDRHNEGMQMFLENLAAEARLWDQRIQKMDDAGKKSGEVTASIDTGWNSASASIEHNVSRAFTGLIANLRDGEDAFKSLENVALRALDNILNALIEASLQQLLFNTVLGSAGPGPAGTGPKGGVSSGLGFIGTALSFIGSIFGFASGTDRTFSVPTLIQVAEHGPERVRVDAMGQERIGGNAGAVINLDLRGSNGDESIERAVQRGLRAAAPGLIEASVNTVRARHLRDPAFLGSLRH